MSKIGLKSFKYAGIDECIKDRDYILANIEGITLEEIIKWCKKYQLPIRYPLFNNEEYVKGSLHKARLGVTKLEGVSDDNLRKLKELSRQALDKLGWDYNC